MEIKILDKVQISQAISLADKVYYMAVEQNVDRQMSFFFHDYARTEKLETKVESGEVVLFGAFEQDAMMGMSALHTAGQITMLYVDSMYLRQGVGRQLVKKMASYTCEVLNRNRLTANVFPYGSVEFFKKCGFGVKNEFQPGMQYVPMDRDIYKEELAFEKRPVKWKAWGIAFLVVVLLIFLVVLLFILSYFS